MANGNVNAAYNGAVSVPPPDYDDEAPGDKPRIEMTIDYEASLMSADDVLEDPDLPQGNRVMMKFAQFRDAPFKQLNEHPKVSRILIYGVIFALYNAYFISCLVRHSTDDSLADWDWCDGIGFLVILTGFTYTGFVYYMVCTQDIKIQITPR
jgi:hypothetical protein